MHDPPDHPSSADHSEARLRQKLARGDAVVASVEPILHHLLVHRDQALFGDAVVAHLRGMLSDLARQIVHALAGAGGPEDDQGEDIAALLPDVPGLLPHLHAQALEWQVAHRLQQRSGLDPVLSPLLQTLIASDDGAGQAMRFLAAQARFVQRQRRMQLVLGELPADLLQGVLVALYSHARMLNMPITMAQQAEAALRADHDEAMTRTAMLARMVAGLGQEALAGLSLAHAGVAIFATTLALVRNVPRDHAMLMMQNGQQIRLMLELRAAGLHLSAVEDVLLILHQHVDIPEAVAQISVPRAGEVLAQAFMPTVDGR